MIQMNDILREGNYLLKEKSLEVVLPISTEDEQTLLSMIKYIENSTDEEIACQYGLRAAVGIAAPQIGVLKKMIVIWTFDEKGEEHFYPLVNPKLISYSDELTYLSGGEGCLSVDREVEGYVHRPYKVRFQAYLYENGNLVFKRFQLKGYLAIVFQHEYDHLNGILFTERISQENPFFIPDNSKPVIFPKAEENQ